MRVPEVSQMVNHEKSLTALQVRPHENDPALYVHTATLLSRASLFPPPPKKKKTPFRSWIRILITQLSDEKTVLLFKLQTLQFLDHSPHVPWVPQLTISESSTISTSHPTISPQSLPPNIPLYNRQYLRHFLAHHRQSHHSPQAFES